MREGNGLSSSKGIQLVMEVLSQQGLVCEDRRVGFCVTLPGALGSV